MVKKLELYLLINSTNWNKDKKDMCTYLVTSPVQCMLDNSTKLACADSATSGKS